MIKCYGINFAGLPPGEFDNPLGMASGAGDIFGTTGGVMEATLRAASELVTGKPADRLEFTEVRAVEGLRETYVAIGEHNIHVGVANGLTNAKILLDKVKAGEQFHVIEVMACPGGCCGGGGQPYPPEGVKVLDPDLLRRGRRALSDRQQEDAPQIVRKPGDRGGLQFVPRRARHRKSPRTAAHALSRQRAARSTMTFGSSNCRERSEGRLRPFPPKLQPGVNAGPNNRLRRQTPVNGRGSLSCIAPFLLAVVACLAGCSQLPADGTGAAKDDGKGTAKADSKKVWHWPKVTVSKDTTYFTEPLRADGGVDYVAAFNRRCSEGVTPENNAAVALWRASGPKDLDKNIRKQYFQMLGIAELPEKGDYLAFFDDFPEYKAAEQQPDKGQEFSVKAWNDYSAAAEAPGRKTTIRCGRQSWSGTRKILNTLTEGLQRPRFYLPLISPRRARQARLAAIPSRIRMRAR